MYSKKETTTEYDEAKQNLLGYFAVLYEIKRKVDGKDLSLNGGKSVGSTTNVVEAAPIAAPERQ